MDEVTEIKLGDSDAETPDAKKEIVVTHQRDKVLTIEEIDRNIEGLKSNLTGYEQLTAGALAEIDNMLILRDNIIQQLNLTIEEIK